MQEANFILITYNLIFFPTQKPESFKCVIYAATTYSPTQ